MQLTVCIETLFPDRPCVDRCALVRELGISGIELWGLPANRVEEVEVALGRTGCQLQLFCGNRDFSLIDPSEREPFLAELQQSIAHAARLGSPCLTILSDKVDARGIPIAPTRALTSDERTASILEGLRRAVTYADSANVTLLLEPLNTLVDHPGFTLADSRSALEIVRQIGSPRLKLLYDVYHMQVMEGNLIATMEANLGEIGHIHVADVPGRHEPGTGEIHFHNIARMLRASGYAGCVGLECVPRGRSENAVSAFCDVFRRA